MFEPIYILYALIILVGIVYARNKKNVLISLVASFIALNLLNLDFIQANYSMQFVSIFIYELVNVFLSFIILTLTFNFSKMATDGVTTIVELLVSIGLVYLYIFTAGFLLSL